MACTNVVPNVCLIAGNAVRTRVITVHRPRNSVSTIHTTENTFVFHQVGLNVGMGIGWLTRDSVARMVAATATPRVISAPGSPGLSGMFVFDIASSRAATGALDAGAIKVLIQSAVTIIALLEMSSVAPKVATVVQATGVAIAELGAADSVVSSVDERLSLLLLSNTHK